MIDDTLMGINSSLVMLEKQIEESSDIVSACRENLLAAEHILEQAKARTYIDTTGTVAERNAKVTIECKTELERVDCARAEFEYAKSHATGLRDTLSALQTRSANLRAEMKLAAG